MVEETPKDEILTDEEEKDIGIVQSLLDNVNRNVLTYVIAAPSIYAVIWLYMALPDWLIAANGAVLAYHFAKR